MGKRKVLITIAARGGSKGVNNKNIRKIGGLPLIAHTIMQAKKWGKADRIVCSTDSEKIAAIAKKNGVEVPFVRPIELATDTIGKIEVIRHALETVERLSGEKYSIVIDLDVTAPIRKISDIEGAYQLFLSKNPNTVFSVVSSRRNPYFNMVELDANGYFSIVKKTGSSVVRRQDAPSVYDLNASIYVYDRNYLLDKKNKSAISDRSLIFEMHEFSAFDIDSESDLKFVEFLLSQGVVDL
ncbi:MAG: acylneuraminate cytidylyltransferase family protein [Candidatus Saganbacteria bacterium]|nr:acylneuraminate cytidylyltransferase family protein [Candidatus Saganbacteria bacterium]